MLKRDKDFELIQDDQLDECEKAIKILSGHGKGIVFRFGDVQIFPILNDEGNMNIAFDYDIIHNPENLKAGDELHIQMADILNGVFSEAVRQKNENE